jgi:CRISPR-associated protein Csx14
VPEPKYTHTLLAMLGGQPQVVTFTLDLLLRHDYPIREVIVIHPFAAQPRLQHSLARLNAEFISDCYRFDDQIITCHFRPKVLELDATPLDDIADSTSAKGARETIYHFIQELKRQPRHIHLSVTGGRRLMSLLAISAAQLKFDPFDHIWHIYTPDALKEQVREGKLMHVPPDAGVKLIEVPFIPLGAYFAGIEHIADSTQAVQHHMDIQERRRCQHVEQALAHKRPLDILKAFAKGMSPQEVASTLFISLSTVSTHTSKIFNECRTAWDLPENHPLTYHFLREHFGMYFGYNE